MTKHDQALSFVNLLLRMRRQPLNTSDRQQANKQTKNKYISKKKRKREGGKERE